MTQQARDYKLQGSARRAERSLSIIVWLLFAGLLGWAVALFLGLLGDRQAASLPAWQFPPLPTELQPKAPPVQTAANPAQSNTPWSFVGIADGRVYVRSGNQPMSFAAGEKLPNGDVLRRVEKDAVVIVSGDKESRVQLFKFKSNAAANEAAKAAAASTSPAAAACRLSAQDRSQATWIEPAVATALSKEQAIFTRIFVPIVGGSAGSLIGGSPGGVRATATGGTTAMFGIQDGDTLLRADGKALSSGMNMLNDVIAPLQRGETVVVEGERSSVSRRWVFAPTSCK